MSWHFSSRAKATETPEEAQLRCYRHREAAAKYRETNRAKIRIKAWERHWYRYVAQILNRLRHPDMPTVARLDSKRILYCRHEVATFHIIICKMDRHLGQFNTN